MLDSLTPWINRVVTIKMRRIYLFSVYNDNYFVGRRSHIMHIDNGSNFKPVLLKL